MEKNIAIYTAIFGAYDGLIPQKKFAGVDYICFTDQDFESNVWKIIKCEREFEDDNRNAKRFKVLPHKYLSSYKTSIWIDGNFVVRKNPHELLKNHLSVSNMLVFDHPRNCIYQEYEAILDIKRKDGILKDDPEIMKQQMERYRQEGYPPENGLTSGGILIRNHMQKDVIDVMSLWWAEISKGSKRDQLSFQYVVWKLAFKIEVTNYMVFSSPWFMQLGVHRRDYCTKYLRYRIREFLGLIPDHHP